MSAAAASSGPAPAAAAAAAADSDPVKPGATMVINMPPKKQTPAPAAAATAAPAAAAPAAPAAAPAQQQQMTEEQMTAKVLEDLRTSLQGKNFPAIINQAFARLKDKTKPHGPQLKEMHEALANIDLRSASRILRMIKGRPKGSAATAGIQMQQQQQPIGPMKGLQSALLEFKQSVVGTAAHALNSATKRRGGFRTRRNLHNRKRTNKVRHRR